MKVIICGAGQVGWQIARHLSGEKNDVTVVDNEAKRLREEVRDDRARVRIDLRHLIVDGRCGRPALHEEERAGDRRVAAADDLAVPEGRREGREDGAVGRVRIRAGVDRAGVRFQVACLAHAVRPPTRIYHRPADGISSESV